MEDLLARARWGDEKTRVDALADLQDVLERQRAPTPELRTVVQAILDMVRAENSFDVQEALIGCLLHVPPVGELDYTPVLSTLARDEHHLDLWLDALYIAGPAWWPKIEVYREHRDPAVRVMVASLLPPGRQPVHPGVRDQEKEDVLSQLASRDEETRLSGLRDLTFFLHAPRWPIPETRAVLQRVVDLVSPTSSRETQEEALICLLCAPIVITWPRLLSTSILSELDLNPLLETMEQCKDESLLPLFLDVLHRADMLQLDPSYRATIEAYREHASPEVRAKVESLLGPR